MINFLLRFLVVSALGILSALSARAAELEYRHAVFVHHQNDRIDLSLREQVCLGARKNLGKFFKSKFNLADVIASCHRYADEQWAIVFGIETVDKTEPPRPIPQDFSVNVYRLGDSFSITKEVEVTQEYTSTVWNGTSWEHITGTKVVSKPVTRVLASENSLESCELVSNEISNNQTSNAKLRSLKFGNTCVYAEDNWYLVSLVLEPSSTIVELLPPGISD